MNKSLRLAALTLMASVVAASCGSGSSSDDDNPAPAPAPAPGEPSYVIHSVAPSTVDAAAGSASDTPADNHIVIPPVAGSVQRNKLFVFLPGTDGTPNLYQLILKAGASRGFHTIGLDYPNARPVGVLCSPGLTTDPNCFWDVRRAIITGDSVSQDVSITPPNSIVTRLTEAVAYLNKTYPTEGWAQYLVSNQINWEKVVIGGHSQGGGHAGVMAKLYSMSRACYFASPPDWDQVAQAPAAWEAYANVTPSTKQFGFAGLQDPSVPYSQLLPIWQTIGLPGTPTLVDGATPPYGGTNMLTTNATPTNSESDVGTPLHGVTVRDAFTPLTSSGAPVFDAAWGYLCFQ